MTPEQKAKDLMQKMDVIHYMKLISRKKTLPISMHNTQVKQCALLAVEEIFKVLPDVQDLWEYWEDVKLEIEKL